MHPVVALVLRRMRAPLVILVLAYAVSILGLVLIPGTDEVGRPTQMSFFHAFYFVSYMATTIGFGEIPHGFTDGQRMWVIFSIYLTVVSWLYAIGKILTLVQDRQFRQYAEEHAFERQIRSVSDPFYVVCGYGDTGSMLTHALVRRAVRVVVVDIAEHRINSLRLAHLPLYVPGLCADATRVLTLKEAGLLHPQCLGVVALTDSDKANLKVAITAKLLNPSMKVICRAETHDAEANMDSFGTDTIINPFDIFAERLALALHSPGAHILHEWLHGVPQEPLPEPVAVPEGRWVLCGYGRFGKAVYANLQEQGVETTIVEALPEEADCIGMCVVGRGTEAETLDLANIDSAVGIVAGTDDDTNNLSIIITANELNPELFKVARQNLRDNDDIFLAADLDLLMRRSHVIAHDIFARLTNPLLTTFLEMSRDQSRSWVNLLVSRIAAVVESVVPELWTISISAESTPAVVDALTDGVSLRLDDIFVHGRDRAMRHAVVVLLLRSDGGHYTVTPEPDQPLQEGDQLLVCSAEGVEPQVQAVLKNHNVLHYVRTGAERPSGYVWALFSRWRARGAVVPQMPAEQPLGEADGVPEQAIATDDNKRGEAT